MELGLTKRELLYTFAAMFFMLYISFAVTLVHETGHALAAIALGGTIKEFVATPFNGGYVHSHFEPNPNFSYDFITAIVLISGGLAASLLFILIGFFKRPFLVCVPILMLQGFAEALGNLSLNHLCMDLFSLFTVVICMSILYDKLWRNPVPDPIEEVATQ